MLDHRSGGPRGTRRASWLPPALAALVAVVCRAPSFLHRFLDGDEGTYAAVAALINRGGTLYESGGVDNKFPAIYWTYALVFRVFGRYTMGAVHVVALGFVLGTCAVLALLALRLGSARAAWLVVLFYGVFTAAFNPKILAANTEVFMMLPLSAAVLLALPSDEDGEPPGHGALFASGALVGLACLWKQVAVTTLPVICFAALWPTRRPSTSPSARAPGRGVERLRPPPCAGRPRTGSRRRARGGSCTGRSLAWWADTGRATGPSTAWW